jgi:hypothetical protein
VTKKKVIFIRLSPGGCLAQGLRLKSAKIELCVFVVFDKHLEGASLKIKHLPIIKNDQVAVRMSTKLKAWQPVLTLSIYTSLSQSISNPFEALAFEFSLCN